MEVTVVSNAIQNLDSVVLNNSIFVIEKSTRNENVDYFLYVKNFTQRIDSIFKLSEVDCVRGCTNLWIFKHCDMLMFCIQNLDEFNFYKMILECNTMQFHLELASTLRIDLVGFNMSFIKLGPNLITQPPSKSFGLFDTNELKYYDVELPTENETTFSIPYLTAFVTNERYYYIDLEFSVVTSVSLTDNADLKKHKISLSSGSELPKGEYGRFLAYVFENWVVILDHKNFYRLNRHTWQMEEITAYVNRQKELRDYMKENNIFLDKEPLLVFVKADTDGIQIKRADWSLLEMDECDKDHHYAETLCPICYSKFTLPKFLVCGHTICYDCEQKMTERRFLKCPVCRTMTGLGERKGLPVNWLVKNLLEQNIVPTKVKMATCTSCSTDVPQDQVFNCDRCSDKEERFLCGVCALNNHISHIVDVKQVKFLPPFVVQNAIDSIKRTFYLEADKADSDRAVDEAYKNLFEKKKRAIEMETNINQMQLITRKSLYVSITQLKTIYDEIEQDRKIMEKTQKIAL